MTMSNKDSRISPTFNPNIDKDPTTRETTTSKIYHNAEKNKKAPKKKKQSLFQMLKAHMIEEAEKF